ncbi:MULTISPECIES: 3'-5' exonuclease [Pseudomonas]|uniref:3'-5' exonuclease n=1 Tax=Pseudomonas TaxID=286 RepID=UPI000F019D38|nr:MULTISPECIES: 3'-5' exonuclease [Pseudomonas]MBD8615571.1 exonuclease domain-containing protein [Pseudomonas putida]MBD8681777.1 exonuclease domain-containing protein [Pseudomonas sp. CFBP 13719]
MSADHSKITCFDLEMCCWEDARQIGEIISFGVCELDLKSGELKREAHYYVKPVVDTVSDFCTNLTGITQRVVNRQGRPLSEVVNSITAKFGTKRPYVSWGDDGDHLARMARRQNFYIPNMVFLNAALLYQLRKRHVGESIGLKRAMEREGLEFEGDAHNALNDSRNMARLITQANLI